METAIIQILQPHVVGAYPNGCNMNHLLRKSKHSC